MPAVSVDTFFACSLMVIVVLSAMAGASKILYPYASNAVDQNVAKRYEEISKYLLLTSGKSANWGQNGETNPETFGLAKTGSTNPYDLDIDKVSRLNSENQHAISYAEVFTSLKLPDVSFKLELKPIFEVNINLTATLASENETIYEFEILTQKGGNPIQTELKYYLVAEDYLDASDVYASIGKAYQNVTIPNSVNGSALLVVFARHAYNAKIVSFGAYAFAHNSPEPKSAGTFLRLSPLDYVLNASSMYPGLNTSHAYALTFDYSSILVQITINPEFATYEIPHFLGPNPTMIVSTGWNSSLFFAEWVAYPQIPLQLGADFASATSLSNVFVYTYMVMINSAVYECTIWLGGPRE
jgi:hypothetical protein